MPQIFGNIDLNLDWKKFRPIGKLSLWGRDEKRSNDLEK